MPANTSYSFNLSYWCLAILRVALVCIPQLGYIHPDEFFQSVEVLAGKFLEIEHQPPWEFNATFPLRSVAIPYFTFGYSFKILKEVNLISKEFFGTTILSPYLILVVPRLLICIFSFVVDYCLYKICVNNNEKFKSKAIILGSSYVMLTYACRTFLNTIELILFALLLYFVCESLTFSNILTKKREYINYHYDKSKSNAERAKYHKLRLYLVSDSLRNCFVISTITVFGFFNRPTFLGFALFPVFFWLYRGIGSKSVTALQFNFRLIALCISSIPSLILIIVIDSFYYGYLTLGEIGMMDISINNFVFTPLNFVKYNLNQDNLAEHGLHPRFLHLLVNVPLLFNILGICLLVSICNHLFTFAKGKYHLLPTVRSIKGLMTLSAITPVLLLSIFPHQEPRFIIPIILPLAYLFGNTIYPESDNILVEAQKVDIKTNIEIKQNSNFIIKLWLSLNIILCVFYGFIHQGGIYPVVNHLVKDLQVNPLTTNYHIITNSIYMIPESLFIQKSTDKIYTSNKSKYTVNKRVFLYHEGSANLNTTFQKINSIFKDNVSKKKIKVFLIVPSSREYEMQKLMENEKLLFSSVETFYPHLSIEAFPNFRMYCLNLFYAKGDDCIPLPLTDYLYTILSLFSLKLYEIQY